MADIDLSGNLTSIARAQSASRDTARARSGSQSAPVQRPTPAPVTDAPTTVPPTVAPDVLVAAQEARQTARPRGFDVRTAYGDTPRPPQDSLTQDAVIQNSPGDNVIALFEAGGEAGASGAQGFASGAETPAPDSSNPTANPARADFTRANQAYVGAGAADGQVFAHSGVDSSKRTASQTFDILI